MIRIILSFMICTIISTNCLSQCPDLPNNVEVNGTPNTSFSLCGTQSASFSVGDGNLPNGTIDWYSSTTSGFDPLAGGTLIGSSPVTSSLSECSTCPEIEALYIDVCNDLSNPEEDNEFMVVSSGSGFEVNNFSLSFPNPAFGNPDSDINTGDLCNWVDGDLSLISGCGAEIIAAGPGDYIPANSIVIIQTSTTGTITYDMSPLCGIGDCIYVLQNSCDRNSAGFKNCDATGGTRTVTINLGCGCSNPITYDIANICSGGGGGTYITKAGVVGNSGCNTAPTIPTPPIVNHNSNVTPFNHSFATIDCNTTQYIVGVLNSAETNADCCGEASLETTEYEFTISCPTAELMGNGNLCPGECVEIDVVIIGGVSPYELNLQVTGLVFPIPVTLPTFPLNGQITICYDAGGPIIDPATNTVDVPLFLGGFSGGLELISFTDSDGCAGTVNGSSISIEFNDEPEATIPPPLTACDMGDGTAFFLLNDLDLIINGNTALTVNYYSDNTGLTQITSPYQSASTTIYAQVIGNPCNSDIIPVELQVISNGDAGVVNITCDTGDGPNTDCTICDTDGIAGADVTLSIFFQDPTVTYDFEVRWTAISGPSSTITGTSVNGEATITHTVFEITTFEIILVDPDNDCPDNTGLGDIITISYGISPDMDDPGDLTNCGPVELPVITGNEIPPNAGYYTMPNGMGTMFGATDVLFSNTTLYLYGGFDGCDQEFPIDVTILSAGTIDDPGPISACGTYILPPLTGTNVDNANYYTITGGGGSIVPVGTSITSSTQLFIYDPVCNGNEVTLDITITPGSIITTGPDTTVCDTFILTAIEGIGLTGNEAYYESLDGSGQQIAVGDTFTSDTLIYIYDNTPGCIIQVPYQINVSGLQFPGLDTSIVICQGDAQLYDINQLLAGGTPDLTGTWMENGSTIVIDSTMVDFSSLGIGQYIFEYEITDTLCADTSATLTVNITGIANAGLDSLLAVCEDLSGVNVYEILGNPDQGGIFVDNTGTPAPFDPLNATFLADGSGLQVYKYIVGDPNSACGADTSIFSVITGAFINAGQNVSRTLCAGESLILNSILLGNTSIGIFSEPSTSGALTVTGVFESGAVSDGEYTVYHIINGSGQCPPDTAFLTITVVDGPSAGDEQVITSCGGLTIDLESEIDPAADPNGDFYFGNNLVTDTEIDLSGITGDQLYLYIVGNGITCPFDTAEILIQLATAPPFELTIDNSVICPDDCATVTLNAVSDGAQTITAHYSIMDAQGNTENRTTQFGDLTPAFTEELCEGIGLLSDNVIMSGNVYTITYDSMVVLNENCTYYPNLTVSVEVLSNSSSNYERAFCNDTTIVIGINTYDMVTTQGVSTLISSNGCDSIVTVDISFLNTIPGFVISDNNCSGDTITILGIEYTDDFFGDTLLVGASSDGCDSLVTIDVSFLNTNPGSFTNEYCTGDIITILGVEFTSTFQGDTILVGASTNGCDSIVSLDLTFLELESQNRFIGLCPGEDTLIGGVLFTESYNSGLAIVVNGGSNGCDLELNVIVTYTNESMGMLDTTVCSNYSIDINDNTYDMSMPTGMEILEGQAANGCDSLLMIDLDFSISGVDSLITESTCDNGFFIQIGTETFNRTNPTGEAISEGINGECDTLFTVELTFGEMTVDITEIDAGCEVVDTGSVIINEITGVPPYNLIYNGNNTIAFVLPVEISLPVGTGEILITDDSGCMLNQPYTILESQEFDFSILQNGNQLTITGGEPDSVLWTPNDSISCIDCTNPIVNPESTTVYTATVYYGGDCIVELEYVFEVDDFVEDYIVPSIFSPNSDGVNDNFRLVITDGAIGVPVLMEIYDRWGNKMDIKTGNDVIDLGWNGQSNGSAVSAGVYVYRIQVLELDRVVNLYGDITVIR